MPQFIMPFASSADCKSFAALDSFTQGYVECLFFTECHRGLEDMTFRDLGSETLKDIIEDCADFQRRYAHLLTLAYATDDYSEEQAGHDFWLTRNHHGAGFWDRGLPDGLGKALTDAARYGELSAYVGDDGKMYL